MCDIIFKSGISIYNIRYIRLTDFGLSKNKIDCENAVYWIIIFSKDLLDIFISDNSQI